MIVVIVAIGLFLTGCAGSAKPADNSAKSTRLNTLDKEINHSALQIQNGLRKGSTIIVYQFQSQNIELSNYILQEIFNLLVNSKQFFVLDRTAQSVIDTELKYQYETSEGMISDESLASLTKRIGAQAIVSGSLEKIGDEYRFRIKVIGTETTAAIVSYVGSINKNDKGIVGILGPQKNTGEKLGTGALNVLLGLGSYLEGDVAGGITITAGYAAAAGLFVVEAKALDWDNPAVGIPATVGVSAAGLSLVYGFARPFIYNHSPKLASTLDNSKSEIILTSNKSGENNNHGFQLTYNLKF